MYSNFRKQWIQDALNVDNPKNKKGRKLVEIENKNINNN